MLPHEWSIEEFDKESVTWILSGILNIKMVVPSGCCVGAHSDLFITLVCALTGPYEDQSEDKVKECSDRINIPKEFVAN